MRHINKRSCFVFISCLSKNNYFIQGKLRRSACHTNVIQMSWIHTNRRDDGCDSQFKYDIKQSINSELQLIRNEFSNQPRVLWSAARTFLFVVLENFHKIQMSSQLSWNVFESVFIKSGKRIHHFNDSFNKPI